MISGIVSNVIPTGIPQFVRQQDQNASAMLSLGGGPRRANNYLLDGVPIGDIFNRAVIQPSIEALEEVKVQVSTYDAELGRTAGGVFNATHQIGVQRLARQRAAARAAAMGHRQTVLHAEDRSAEAGHVLPSVGRFVRRAARQESHVLLGQHGGLQHPDDGEYWSSPCRRHSSAAATIRNPPS